MSIPRSRCRNCRCLPVVTEQRGYYPFVLRHPDNGCPPHFHLDAHHRTADKCIAVWNAFNKGPIQ